MYAVIEASGTYPVKGSKSPKTRRWGEPHLAFIARTWEEVQDWWTERCEKTPLCDQLRGYDYIAVLTPEGVVSLAGDPIKGPINYDYGWVQVRMGVYGVPETD